MYHDGPAAECFRLEADAAQLLAVRLERIEFFIGQLQHKRKQQPLSRRPAATQLRQHCLVENPFMSRVLVHDDYALRPLVHDVAVEYLDQRHVESGRRLTRWLSLSGGGLGRKKLAQV
jgi:hypothetical protein